MDQNQKEEIFSQARARVDAIKEMVIQTINELDATVSAKDSNNDILRRWEALQALMSAGKAAAEPEMVARKEAMAVFFPNPVEGTNTVELAAGWKLKGVRKIDRKLEEASLPDTVAALREAGVLTDRLIQYKPELKISEFRELTEEQVKILSASLTEKDASPSLELVPPKNRK